MTVIYCFSGSGNSLAVSKDVADRLGAEVRMIVDTPADRAVSEDVDAIGFVYPNYDFKAPDYVDRWISGADGLAGRYVFALCTYGISAGRSLEKLNDTLAGRGARLSAGFAVQMPHNGIGSSLQPDRVREAIQSRWSQRLEDVVTTIANRESREPESGSTLLGFLRNQSWKMLPGLFRYLGVWMREGEAGLAYNADDRCNACGVCARLCPVENIAMHDGRPSWGSTCTNCFGCLHWCPTGAIHLGRADLRIDQPYHHPAVTLADMIRRPA